MNKKKEIEPMEDIAKIDDAEDFENHPDIKRELSPECPKFRY